MGAAPPDSDLLYFAFGNYTTLGYGDVTPVDGWQLLGPITALNALPASSPYSMVRPVSPGPSLT
ncbi:MAG TPA: ion channel [Methyloceanibacter sp.]|nr:ion channel [Methyloceanibacter sp.]